MFIFNITVNIQEDIQEAWVDWVKHTYMPRMLSLDTFSKAVMTRVLVEEEMGGYTYSIQYTAPNKTKLESFRVKNRNPFGETPMLFKDKFVYFTTELHIIDEQ
jgi:hypothetical protein